MKTKTKDMKYRISHRCRPGRLSDWINPYKTQIKKKFKLKMQIP